MIARIERGVLRRFIRERSGVTAIEFGIVGPVFLAMLCGTIFFGMFYFNCTRVDRAAYDASRSVMMIVDPTVESIAAEVDAQFAKLNLEGTETKVSIVEREDGGRDAVISASLTITDPTAFLNTEGFQHSIEYHVPLWEN